MCSVCYVQFTVVIIDPVSGLFSKLWTNFAPVSLYWTSNNQIVCAECAPKRILLLFPPVSTKTAICRFDTDRNVTVNGERYRSMITNFFLPKMEELNSVDMWFQQDGATSHTAGETMDQLRDQFGERLISRFGAVNWPPRSCDLTPLDFFLWGYVKSLVYTDNPNSIAALETNIERVMAEIPVEMCEKVCQNWTFRMDHLKRSRGQHLHEIIFKK